MATKVISEKTTDQEVKEILETKNDLMDIMGVL